MGRRFMGEDDKPKTLVGISGEVRAVLQSDPPPTAYYPYWQRVPDAVALVIRTTGDPRSAAGFLRAALRERGSATADPGHPHHGRGDRWFSGAAQISVDADRGICRFRAAGGQPGHLRRCRLLRGPPPERNRHPNGARRAALRNCWAGDSPGYDAGCAWHGCRSHQPLCSSAGRFGACCSGFSRPIR